MRLGLSLLLSGLLCALVFCCLYRLSENLTEEYAGNVDFERAQLRKQRDDLQRFADRNGVSTSSLEKLKKWESRHPVILLELYDGTNCIYSSIHDSEGFYELPFCMELAEADSGNAFSVRLQDRTVTAVLFSDFTYRYYLLGTALSFALSLTLFVVLFLCSIGRLIRYICTLNKEVQILEGGDLGYTVTVQGNDEITDLAKSMNRMKDSLREQKETEQQIYQASRRLITEMSHDLRTPLTGILLYLEILRSHRYETEDQLRDYLDRIDTKAKHMKLLSDHLFEYALDGSLERKSESVEMERAFKEPLGSFMDDLSAAGCTITADLEWERCLVRVRPDEVRRIFENIASNIAKYADKSAAIRIGTVYTDRFCGFTVLNACAAENTASESTGIGMESIRAAMRRMGGICTVEMTESLYEITLLFPQL
jgi:signal transduction histidine kinase